MFETITPQAAWQAMGAGDAIYIDVRTTAEFAAGHPEGAYHVPLMDADPRTGAPSFNSGFVQSVQALADTLGQKREQGQPMLVVGCKVGGRSRQACELLAMNGIDGLADCAAGWSGQRDGYGRPILPGWSLLGLPSAASAQEGRSWPEIQAISTS